MHDTNRLGALPSGTGLSQAEPEVSALRASIPSAMLDDLLAIVRAGYWGASVFHCPDKKGWPRGSIAGAQALPVPGKFESETAALRAARAAMETGRIRDVFVHGPTARPTAYYRLDHQQINSIGRLASAIDAGTDETAQQAQPEGQGRGAGTADAQLIPGDS